jgi:cytochrome c oxidase assembly protein subunit 16
MPTFQSNRYVPPSASSVKYRRLVHNHPFLFFGLPFIGLMVAGSFFLTPATAIRYEKHDHKVKRASTEEALSVGRNKRKVDPREEYYVSYAGKRGMVVSWGDCGLTFARN